MTSSFNYKCQNSMTSIHLSICISETNSNLVRRNYLDLEVCNAEEQFQSRLFSQLPLEVRLMVWKFVLQETDAGDYLNNQLEWRPEFQHLQMVDTALLRTCKRTYVEASHLPLQSVTHRYWYGIPSDGHSFLGSNHEGKRRRGETSSINENWLLFPLVYLYGSLLLVVACRRCFWHRWNIDELTDEQPYGDSLNQWEPSYILSSCLYTPKRHNLFNNSLCPLWHIRTAIVYLNDSRWMQTQRFDCFLASLADHGMRTLTIVLTELCLVDWIPHPEVQMMGMKERIECVRISPSIRQLDIICMAPDKMRKQLREEVLRNWLFIKLRQSYGPDEVSSIRGWESMNHPPVDTEDDIGKRQFLVCRQHAVWQQWIHPNPTLHQIYGLQGGKCEEDVARQMKILNVYEDLFCDVALRFEPEARCGTERNRTKCLGHNPD